MDASPLRLEDLTRRFGTRVALEGATFDVGPGEIVGLTGPNGSGKTTLLELVAGLLRPSSGSVRVFGLDPVRAPERVMRRARFAFAPPALFPHLSAREHLVHLGRLHAGLRGAALERDVAGALARVGLVERARDRVETFSFGMRQRLALAQALVPPPELLVLDEPTDGLDPLAVLELRAVLAALRSEDGTAVLLSSHLLVELEHLVDRLVVLSEGRTVFRGPPADLTARGETLRLGVADEEAAERGRSALAAHGLAAQVVAGPVGRAPAELALARGALGLADAGRLLAGAGVSLASYHVHRPTLEEALLERLRAQRARAGDDARAGEGDRP